MSKPSANSQLDTDGQLKHFLTTEGHSRELLTQILDRTETITRWGEQGHKKLPALKGQTVVNLFFEDSTRTRNTFEIAEKRLSADVVNFNIKASATSKGETLLDTLRNLEAMQVDLFVVRHGHSGAAHFIANQVAPHISVVNAGDGRHAHPTQAMLDMFTIRRHKPQFDALRVAIVGDVLHSRVARSQIHALSILQAGEIRIVGPRTLLPCDPDALGVRAFHNLEQGLADVDVIIMLRLQRERMAGALLPSEAEYFQLFGLTEKRLELADPDVIVMHPGPINRNVEMDSQVADGTKEKGGHSVILEQVTHGIATRMSVLSLCRGIHIPEPAPAPALSNE